MKVYLNIFLVGMPGLKTGNMKNGCHRISGSLISVKSLEFGSNDIVPVLTYFGGHLHSLTCSNGESQMNTKLLYVGYFSHIFHLRYLIIGHNESKH